MINQILDNTKIKTKDWILKNAHGAKAKWWLILVSFSESSVLFLPTDTFLIAILMVGAKRWVYYSGITSVASVLGGVFGYLVGFSFFEAFGDKLVSLYGIEEEIANANVWYEKNAFWSIFLAGLIPVIPYKVFSLTAGMLSINFWVFLIASIFSRSLRFFAVGYIVKIMGPQMGKILFKYFNIISFIVILAIFVLIALNWG